MAVANGVYGAKFPPIQMDGTVNYPNAQYNIKKITVEEYNDLLHHTHKLNELMDSEGHFLTGDEVSVGVSSSDFNALKARVESLEESGTGSSSGNYATQEALQTLQELVNVQSGLITTLTNKVAALENASSSGGIEIGDWDVEREGIQGPND